MKSAEFRNTLLLALRGNHQAVARILLLYEPLIEHASTVSGHPDEDLKQFIYLRILSALQKFRF